MPDLTPLIIIGPSKVQQLTTTFGIKGVQPLQRDGNNPYGGKIPQPLDLDSPLYTSLLGTPIFCDLTLGDPTNQGANTYTDENGIRRSFKAMTFETVLLTIQQTKNIVKTDIQGKPGTVKEYIGLGDYIVTINGILPGSNGIYPRDDVSQLKQILVAPIAMASTSWWLQLFDIHNVVIEDYDVPQLPGEQSQQTFSIHALSDYQPEANFIPGA